MDRLGIKKALTMINKVSVFGQVVVTVVFKGLPKPEKIE